MVIGGSAAPPSMIDGFKKRHGLEVVHAWGMTEMNPLGTVAHVKRHLEGASEEALLAVRSTQGFSHRLRRDAAHRRHRAHPPLGREVDGRARGARAVGRVLLLP